MKTICTTNCSWWNTKSMVANLCRMFGEPCVGDGEAFTFPTPERLVAVSEDDLKEAKLGFRARYVAEFARRVADGDLDLDAWCGETRLRRPPVVAPRREGSRQLRREPPPDAARSLRRDPLRQRSAGVPGGLAQGGAEGGRTGGGETVRALGTVLLLGVQVRAGVQAVELRGHRGWEEEVRTGLLYTPMMAAAGNASPTENSSEERHGLTEMSKKVEIKWLSEPEEHDYPKGLTGNEIPLAARIVAIADVYDALSNRRVYKEAFPHEKCVEIIKDGAGTSFDPGIVAVFLELQSKFRDIAEWHKDASNAMNEEPPRAEETVNSVAASATTSDEELSAVLDFLEQCTAELSTATCSSSHVSEAEHVS